MSRTPKVRVAQEAIVWGLGTTLLLQSGRLSLDTRELITRTLQASCNSDSSSGFESKAKVVGTTHLILPVGKEALWGRIEFDDRLGRGCGKTLFSPDVSGNAIPAPRVDGDSSSTVRLDVSSYRDTCLALVSDELTADDVVSRQGAHPPKDLDLSLRWSSTSRCAGLRLRCLLVRPLPAAPRPEIDGSPPHRAGSRSHRRRLLAPGRRTARPS
jgi:hypothetical protein